MRLSSHAWLALIAGTALVGACATGSTVTGSGSGDDDTSSSNQNGGAGPVGPGPGGSTPANTGTGGSAATGEFTTSSTGGATSTSTSTSTTSTSSTSTSTTSASSTSVSSTSGGCTNTNILNDGGFEAGPGGVVWTQSSTNFGTPICDVASCGMGGGSGPATGNYWVWIGGVGLSSILPETASVEQFLTIPASSMATLQFKLQIPVCDSFFDEFAIGLDGNPLFYRDGSDVTCGQTTYQQHSINISSYADGLSHHLQIIGDNESVLFGATNFFVDDVQLIVCL